MRENSDLRECLEKLPSVEEIKQQIASHRREIRLLRQLLKISLERSRGDAGAVPC